MSTRPTLLLRRVTVGLVAALSAVSLVALPSASIASDASSAQMAAHTSSAWNAILAPKPGSTVRGQVTFAVGYNYPSKPWSVDWRIRGQHVPTSGGTCRASDTSQSYWICSVVIDTDTFAEGPAGIEVDVYYDTSSINSTRDTYSSSTTISRTPTELATALKPPPFDGAYARGMLRLSASRTPGTRHPTSVTWWVDGTSVGSGSASGDYGFDLNTCAYPPGSTHRVKVAWLDTVSGTAGTSTESSFTLADYGQCGSTSPSPSPSVAPSQPPADDAGYASSARLVAPADGARFDPYERVRLEYEQSGAVAHVYCRIVNPDGHYLVVNPCSSGYEHQLFPGTWRLSVRSVASTGEAAPEHVVTVHAAPPAASSAPASSPSASPTPSAPVPPPAASPLPSDSPRPSASPSSRNTVPAVQVSPFVVRFGQVANVTITGTPGAGVDLYVRKYGGSFVPIRYGLTLDASGRVTVPTKPDMNLRFMARDRTTGTTSLVGGGDGLVTVEKHVSINVRREGAYRYTFSGSINPNHPGAVVHLYRDGRLVRARIPVNGSRAYSWTGTLPAGTGSFRITSPVTGYNNVSHSATRSISIY